MASPTPQRTGINRIAQRKSTMENLDSIFAFCKNALETNFAGGRFDLDPTITLEAWCTTSIDKTMSRSSISGYVTTKVEGADIVVRAPLPEKVISGHPQEMFADIMQYVGEAYKVGWSIRGSKLTIVPDYS